MNRGDRKDGTVMLVTVSSFARKRGRRPWRRDRDLSAHPLPRCSSQHLQIVHCAQQTPFASDLVQPAQQALAETPSLLDLTKYRLDDLLAQQVTASLTTLLEPPLHGLNPSAGRGLIAARRARLTMSPPASGNVATYVMRIEFLEVILRIVSGIGRQFLGSRPRPGLAFKRLLGFADLLDALLFVGDPLRQLIATTELPVALVLLRIHRLGLLQPPIVHRLVLAGIGPQLGAVESHMPELHHLRAYAQLQHLYKQPIHRLQMSFLKVADRPEPRSLQDSARYEIHPLFARLGKASRGVDPLAVGVQQQGRHYRRIVWRETTRFRVGASRIAVKSRTSTTVFRTKWTRCPSGTKS